MDNYVIVQIDNLLNAKSHKNALTGQYLLQQHLAPLLQGPEHIAGGEGQVVDVDNHQEGLHKVRNHTKYHKYPK